MAPETSNYKLKQPLETDFYNIEDYNKNLDKIDTQMKLNANTVMVSRGGTGKTSWSASRLIYPSTSTALTQMTMPTEAGSILRQNPTGSPYWTAPKDMQVGSSDSVNGFTFAVSDAPPTNAPAGCITFVYESEAT